MQKVQATRRLALAGTAAAMTSAIAHGTAAADETIWSSEYQAIKRRNGAEIRLAMYRRRLGAPQPGEAARPVLFLVHGSSNSAMSSFDLAVPGRGEFSSMNVFARFG